MDVVNRDAVTAFVTKDSSIIREILAPRNSAIKRQSLAEATVKQGKATAEHVHPETEEIYYILKGRGGMRIEGEERAVGEGDGIAIPAGKRHAIRNTGKGELVFLCCCVPAYRDEDTTLTE
ncbi:MAG: cupin domain-containing protein [Candidatus Aureabacteria bacterium]|nr:cupin domain-containing protein [Candidatus Auribacterota bacterium]